MIKRRRSKKSRSKNKKIISFVLLLILLLGLLAAAYTIFSEKSPRKFYLETEKNNFKKVSEQIKQAYQDFMKTQEPYMKGFYKSRFELTSDMDSENSEIFGLQNVQSIFDAINKAKLIGDIKTDAVNDKSLVKASLLIDKSPLLDMEAIVNSRKIGFTVPVFTPGTYFLMDMERADEVYDKFNIPVRPTRFLRKIDIAKTLYFKDEEFTAAAGEYGKIISSYIMDGDVEYGSTVVFRAGENDVKVKEVILKINADKTEKLIGSILEKVEKDGLLTKFTYENYTKLISLIDEAGFFQLFDFLEEEGIIELNDFFKQILKKANIKSDLSGFRNTLESFRKAYTYPEGLLMKLLVDSAGNIVNREFHTTFKTNNNDKIYTLNIDSASNDLKNNGFDNRLIEIALGSTDSNGLKQHKHFGISTKTMPSLKSGDKSRKIEIFVSNIENEIEKNAIKADFNIDTKIDKLTLKNTTLTSYAIDVSADDGELVDSFNGEILSETNTNDKFKTINTNTDILINMKLHSFGLKDMSFKFRVVSEDKFGIEQFELPDIQKEKIVDLNTATDAELAKVRMNILASFGAFYFDNKQLIDAIVGAE